VFDIYREGDVVWAQDYHLMLLPAMLKKQHPKMKVGTAGQPAAPDGAHTASCSGLSAICTATPSGYQQSGCRSPHPSWRLPDVLHSVNAADAPEPGPKVCARTGSERVRVPKLWTPNPSQVGWFLHTPFPSSEIYRTLPVREEVLRAVLRADLIGFHTYDYARHFVSAGTRILGLEVRPV
jgi:Glycosyltransferase family 20